MKIKKLVHKGKGCFLNELWTIEVYNFYYGNIKYLAIKYNARKYAIVEKEKNRPVSNMKDIAREYLKEYGIEISTDANVINTYSSIKLVMEHC